MPKQRALANNTRLRRAIRIESPRHLAFDDMFLTTRPAKSGQGNDRQTASCDTATPLGRQTQPVRVSRAKAVRGLIDNTDAL